LLLITVKAGAKPTPEVVLKHKEWVLQEMKSGAMEAVYTFEGSSNGMCIVNLKRPEELDVQPAAAPMRPYRDVEVRQLTDFAGEMDRLAAALKSGN
jgi:muconolactone delta-isomerase